MPQTRYVLQKALARDLPAVVAINKIDRGDARPSEVLDAIYELFIELGASAEQLDFPVLYTNAKPAPRRPTSRATGTDLRPLLDALVATTPPPTYVPEHPAPAAGDQPVRQRLRGPDGRRPHLERDGADGPAHRGRAR